MQGLMSSYPLTLTHVFDRAERIFPEKEVATVQAGGIERITYGEWAERTRRLAGVLDALEISADGRVGTFAWNTARHLELYFAAPCSGRVLHTLNIRLFPDDITYIANHAEDEVVFVDRSLLKVLWPLVDDLETVKHVVVMDDGVDDEIPDDPRIHDYETLLAEADPVEKFSIDDENQAAAMCYTSGTTGHPKGVVYSHRSTVLHSLGAMVADAAAVSERDTVMPVVPMFHANAWGLCQAAVMAGANLAHARPEHAAEGAGRADGVREGHAGRGRPDDLDGRPARARGPRPVARCATSCAAARRSRSRCRRPTASRSGCRSCRPGG